MYTCHDFSVFAAIGETAVRQTKIYAFMEFTFWCFTDNVSINIFRHACLAICKSFSLWSITRRGIAKSYIGGFRINLLSQSTVPILIDL